MPAGPAPEEKWSIFLLAPASLLYYSVFLPPPKIGFDLHRRQMPPPQGGQARPHGCGELADGVAAVSVEEPDLSRVDEIGFTDLMPGSGHGPGGWSDVAWIEVHCKPVKRDSSPAGQ